MFNIGAGNLAALMLLRKVNAGDFAGAAEQLLVWDKARVNGALQPLPGLTRRRRAERALFLGQDWRAAAFTRSRGALAVLPVAEMPDENAAAMKLGVAAPIRRAAPEPTPKGRARAAPRQLLAKTGAMRR